MAQAQEAGVTELRAARSRGRTLIIWTFVFSIFVNLLMLTGPLYMLQVYDRVLSSRSVETLVALTVLVAVLYTLMGVLDYARGRIMARVGARFQSALDARVFEATLRRSVDPRERRVATGALRDLDAVRDLFTSPVLLAVMDIPWTPIFIAAIFLFHPMLGWLAVAGGVIIVLTAVLNQTLTARRVRAVQVTTQEGQSFAEEARQGREVVLSQGLRGAMLHRYLGHRDAALFANIGASDWTGGFAAFTKSFRLFLQSAMLGAGAYYVLQGEMTPGSMIAGSILLGRALAPVEQAMGRWAVLQRGRTGWLALGKYLQAVPAAPQRTALPVPTPELQVTGLTVVAPGERIPTLRNVSFTLEPGQALGVIGRSGAGKSTLARALAGFWPITAGEARLGGATLDQYDPDALGRHIGYLPQTVTLFSGTIAQNIARMAQDPDEAAVIKAAQSANAHQMILRLPNGYDTVLDGNDSQLSGGQRQRIALARALYGDPVLLILDEPNSMLDGDGAAALNTAVSAFKAQGKILIILTHRTKAIVECDHILVLNKGVVVAFGPRDEVLEGAVVSTAPRSKVVAT
ncbi:type I secretion system permease/ATPase [Yoonia sp.]|uniref:type I secretion system permease/ATPase n=1 Tax=Yoonia sp. TaxID=2212373 RepID=UPI0019E99DC6|nr:type I secretion system permease/ATPase [Yoonia sp.]MBE0414349.1 type I secretion system permease/ATPase [Yoonia sp.]